ncbi:MAG TPA: cysteine--1-D-myo-inosityl 2-amino-2-deoxy-alpha-D-glucopyranoside ligase [Mycobacteriales bacterium]|nr:cysteine--1-D-myo-inosityl 2-amino-2-deoxy-alpha-D-glucopyranoside ligase [Mycobacteriales bacterium]
MQSWPAVPLPTLPAGERTPLRLHDTATGGLVDVGVTGRSARLYVCGITPYDATHLGHAATYLAFDTLVRVWRDQGTDVHYVQNVTDIDEPLLERAARDDVDWVALAVQETERFRGDMTALRLLPPADYVGAVESMDDVGAMVDRLLAMGAAYRVESEHGDDIYFSIAAAAHFGEVSGLDAAEMLVLSRERGGDPDRAGKKDPLDCLLWQAQRPGEPGWESPFGAGRPGWHIECAAIAVGRLGPTVDVQGGGSDLVFPHHELSAAQASVATGEWPFARAYVHAGMLGWAGEKMSKSKGNLVFVSDLRTAGVEPAALRLALLDQHYRTDREWLPELLTAAQTRLAAWRSAANRPAGPDGARVLTDLRRALCTDLDTPAALAAVDAWAATVGSDESAPQLVSEAVDALLGVQLA